MKLSPLASAAAVSIVLAVALAVLGMASIDQSGEPNASPTSGPLGIGLLGIGGILVMAAIGCGIGGIVAAMLKPDTRQQGRR